MEVGGKINQSLESNNLQSSDSCCEICKLYDGKTQAEGLCEECEEYMCKACFESHCKAKLCRQHKFVTSDTPLKSPTMEKKEKCKRHKNEIIKYYCRTHDIVGCSDCMIPEHVECKPKCIKDVLINFNIYEEMENRREKLKVILEKNEKNANIIQAGETMNKRMKMDELKKVNLLIADIKNNLDKAEKAIAKDIYLVERNNLLMLRKLENERSQILSRTSLITQMLDPNLHRDSELFIRFIESKAHLEEVERSVNGLEKINFVQGNVFQNIELTTGRLGHISTKDIMLGEVNKPIQQNLEEGNSEGKAYPWSRLKAVDTFRSLTKDTSHRIDKNDMPRFPGDEDVPKRIPSQRKSYTRPAEGLSNHYSLYEKNSSYMISHPSSIPKTYGQQIQRTNTTSKDESMDL